MEKTERKPTNNSLGMLSTYMFDELDRLSEIDPTTNPEALDAEIKRAKALGDVAKVVVENANAMLDAARLQAQYLGKHIDMPRELMG